MTKQTFIQGAMILMVAGIINRVLGFIPRILLPRIIGAEGVGLYQLGYPFFIVLVTIISGGIPLAVAKLIAEAESEGQTERSKTILKASLLFTVGIGVIFTIVYIWGASWISQHILTDPRVYQTFLAMSPMIIIVAVSSVYRGYFQGKQDMIPSAVSSILETVARIICVLWFSYLLLPMGIAYGAAGAMLGVAAGEVVGMAVILWQYLRLRRKEQSLSSKDNPEQVEPLSSQDKGLFSSLKRILNIAIPVTGGKLIGSLSYLLESITTAQSLAIAGIATAIATAQYGALQGMVIPLLLLPGALTSSLAISLVPSLAEAQARGDIRSIHLRLHQSLRLALVTGAPFAAMMYILAEPICSFVYNNTDISGMLKIMAPFALFLYVQAPLQATLQALDKPGRALINTLVGAIIKLGLILYLASNPSFAIYGAIIAIIANMVVVTLLHGYSIARVIKYRIPFLDILKVIGVMIVMAAAGKYVFYELTFGASLGIQLVLSVGIAGLLYLLLVGLTGLVDFSDMKRIPFLKRFIR